jgi:hypothetical protein
LKVTEGDYLTVAPDDHIPPRAIVAMGDLDQPIAIKDADADMVAVGPAFWPSIFGSPVVAFDPLIVMLTVSAQKIVVRESGESAAIGEER